MGGLSIWHWVVVLVVVLVLFGGRGKLSQLMGDAAKGITAFKKGLKDSDEPSETGNDNTAERAEIPPESKNKPDEAAKS